MRSRQPRAPFGEMGVGIQNVVARLGNAAMASRSVAERFVNVVARPANAVVRSQRVPARPNTHSVDWRSIAARHAKPQVPSPNLDVRCLNGGVRRENDRMRSEHVGVS